jgi:DNA-directed RNA polymerase subunit RPC12/RpoP
MFKHRDVPHCQRCGSTLVIQADAAADIVPIDRQWKCPRCGTRRPIVYRVERNLKKPA